MYREAVKDLRHLVSLDSSNAGWSMVSTLRVHLSPSVLYLLHTLLMGHTANF